MMDFFQRKEVQAVFLTAILAVVGWRFREWYRHRTARRPALSERAKQLLGEMGCDTRSSPKGITIFHAEGVGEFYESFRWYPASWEAVNSVCRDIGDVHAAVEELIVAGRLVLDETN